MARLVAENQIRDTSDSDHDCAKHSPLQRPVSGGCGKLDIQEGEIEVRVFEKGGTKPNKSYASFRISVSRSCFAFFWLLHLCVWCVRHC